MTYEIVYSDRRTVSIVVKKDGTIVVRAPRGMTKKEIDTIVHEHEKWIEKSKQRQADRTDRFSDLSDADIVFLKKQAKKILPPMVAKYSQIMGLTYGRITITSAATRFGSCSSEGNLAFSWRLMCYPPKTWEYVVVHELAHRVHMNHSQQFYRLIESVLPDYRARKKLLKM